MEESKRLTEHEPLVVTADSRPLKTPVELKGIFSRALFHNKADSMNQMEDCMENFCRFENIQERLSLRKAVLS